MKCRSDSWPGTLHGDASVCVLQDHSEVDMLDSEDEELMKQAKLVRMKQAFPQDSDDTSDFEDIEEDVIMMRDMKRQLHQVSGPGGAVLGCALH